MLKCCNISLIDYSEPLVVTGFILGAAGFTMALISGTTGLIVITGIVTVSSAVAEWRIRSLGIAKKLMDSVKTLESENDELRENNKELQEEIYKFQDNNNILQSEINKFQDILGLLNNNVTDIEDAKKELFDLYNKYKIENNKQQSNNLLTLFGLVDKNQDSKLSQDELIRLKEYIKIVYKRDFNFDILDKDDDGYVSLQEFFEKFRLDNV